MRLEVSFDIAVGATRIDEIRLAAPLPALDHDVALDPMARGDEPRRILMPAEESIEPRDRRLERRKRRLSVSHRFVRFDAESRLTLSHGPEQGRPWPAAVELEPKR